MKTNQVLMTIAAVVSLSLAATETVSAQAATVQTTTTQNAGTISEFGPETVVIRSETAPEPIRYSTTKTTTYVDENGVPVSIETSE